jgi:secreted PhoX family phosphatase
MSTGLSGRAIAYSGYPVEFTGPVEGQSTINFHWNPDGAMIFPNVATGGFYYASNSEIHSRTGGGVGVLEFDANGEVIDYYRTLTGTSRNCGGGPTPWGSWVSCEEFGTRGRVWQTDPAGVISSRRTEVVDTRGNYECML